MFSPLAGAPRGGVAIGDMILDLRALHDAGLLDGEAQAACHACTGPTLNPFLALGAGPRRALREAVSALLAEGADRRPDLLHPAADCLLYMPAHVGDYTDFYVGIHHATNVGQAVPPRQPAAAQLQVGADRLPRPRLVGAALGSRGAPAPTGSASIRTGRSRASAPASGSTTSWSSAFGSAPGNALGSPVPIGEAAEHIAGYCLLNDWSARDFQAWEYQPLGPFLSKNFHTTISPWIVTPEALAPFRAAQPPRPEGDPRPLPYLLDEADQQGGALDLELEVLLLTAKMRDQGLAPHRLSVGTSLNMYWTPAQVLAHHASNGCNLNPGDLLGSGTISAPTPDGYGSLLEITRGGREPIQLPSGETRRFLEDGDEVILRARAAPRRLRPHRIRRMQRRRRAGIRLNSTRQRGAVAASDNGRTTCPRERPGCPANRRGRPMSRR